MIPIQSSKVAAILIANAPLPEQARAAGSAANVILTVANGVAAPSVSSVGGVWQQAKALVTSSLFDPSVPDPTAMKVNLMERLGKEFGLSMDDFDNRSSFGKAIRDAMAPLLRSPEGMAMIREIERDLGLDKMGVSLVSFVNAIMEPGGADDERVDAALREQAGELLEESTREIALPDPSRFSFDEIGLYSVR